MALEPAAIQELIKKLDLDRTTYLTTLSQFHDRLTQALSAYNQAPIISTSGSQIGPPLSLQSPIARPARASFTAASVTPSSFLELTSNKKPSLLSYEDESSESGDDESFFVQDPLPQEFHSQEKLKEHIKTYPWKSHGRWILDTLLNDNASLDRKKLFEPTEADKLEDADSGIASIYVVHDDGSIPQLARTQSTQGHKGIWDELQTINTETARKKAVGRIITLREPPALLLAACHLTMQEHLNMDFIFQILTDDSPTKAYMKGCMKPEPRHQRSFIFSFKYHTIIGKNRTPIHWQDSDTELNSTNEHIPISTCSSVVALTLSGNPSHTLRRKSRKSKQTFGQVHDPFAPWQVLSIQCYPDWHSNTEVHETNHHYINGPEAFMITIMNEYRDAYKRFKELNRAIVKLVTPPKRFLFDAELRSDLLFESHDYTYSRRYFWAFQALAMLNDEIEAMITQYREIFSDSVWEGDHPFIWPGTKDKSARYTNWRKKMAALKKQFEKEIAKLTEVLADNKREQQDISFLREQLFSGTSVQESREAVKLASFTFEQGQNIRLLTLVSIFFLPLTFVTSVFGMTNMPQGDNFVRFGIATAAVCLPTYVLIVLVEGKSTDRLEKLWRWAQAKVGWAERKQRLRDSENDGDGVRLRANARSFTMFESSERISEEIAKGKGRPPPSSEKTITANGQHGATPVRPIRRETTSSVQFTLSPIEKRSSATTTKSISNLAKQNSTREKSISGIEEQEEPRGVLGGIRKSRTFDRFSFSRNSGLRTGADDPSPGGLRRASTVQEME